MVPVSRAFALSLVAAFALFAAGCESNNKGKIVGKWQATGAVPLVFEFTADGRFIASAAGIELTKGKYSLGMGDTVNLTELSPPMEGKTKGREKITITGDTMNVAGEKPLTFNRMK